MPEVDIKKGEPIDRALKRLKSKMETEGIMDEMHRLRSFETPAQKTKRKARANAKRNKNKFRFTLRTPPLQGGLGQGRCSWGCAPGYVPTLLPSNCAGEVSGR